MIEQVTCKKCAYWLEFNKITGECRRHAPSLTIQHHNLIPKKDTNVTMPDVVLWPTTVDDDWCGEAKLSPYAKETDQ